MTILETNSLKEKILKKVKKELENKKKATLASINVGSDKASNSYLKQIERMCNYINCEYINFHYDNITENELLNLIDKLNNNPIITSILICLPLPSYLDKNKIINSISPTKDVDGLSDINIGKTLRNASDAIISATANGIKNIFEKYNITLKKRNVLIINRSNLIGKPLASLLLEGDATVTICHSKTNNLKEHLQLADIVITAVGKANFLTSDTLKDNAVVIDAGVSYYHGKICGDFKNTNDNNIFLCSAPNGVGNMTIANLALNILKCYHLNNK